MRSRILFVGLAMTLAVFGLTSLVRSLEAADYAPNVAPASDDFKVSLDRIKVPEGFKIDLFAAEPALANPVSFSIDNQGKIYVVETFRIHKGGEDIRGHMTWLDDDLASRSVEDRINMYKKHMKGDLSPFEKEHDRVRLIEDRDGDHKADFDSVFADGFNTAATSVAAGVLARGKDVYFTCIPDLWLLRDEDGDGKAEHRESLHYGYGVRVGFMGHDLHGLRFGPDGRLYFSIGDRGINVRTKEGTDLKVPNTGCVMRCEPDGSKLEIFAFGLRNPQELAFDEHGNLFTGDNNSDSGDKARWVYLVDGGNSGWQIGYQFFSGSYSRGPWNAEKLWHPQWDGQAAYIVPPIVNLSDGPSGLTYYPGTGFPDKYKNTFFLCDFRGATANVSGIYAIKNKPKGAGFELESKDQFVWQVLGTDADFGPDGAMYITDWVHGWSGQNKGRIFRLFDPATQAESIVKEVQELLNKGLEGKSDDELVTLLSHVDYRVRLEAQFALAKKGTAAGPLYLRVATNASANPLGRLHALWGLGQISRVLTDDAAKQPLLQPVIALLGDSDREVAAQAAKILGEGKFAPATDPLIAQLTLENDNARVAFFAAEALGKIDAKSAIAPLVKLLDANADKDPFLRHAAVMGLTRIADPNELVLATKGGSPAVRIAALLALRRHESPLVTEFLADTDPRIVLEAARAINDLPIEAGRPALAQLIDSLKPDQDKALIRRVLNANFRIAGTEQVAALGQFAANSANPEWARLEVLAMFSDWATPSGRDRVVGNWIPVTSRTDEELRAQLVKILPSILETAPTKVRVEGAKLAGQYKLTELSPVLHAILANPKSPGDLGAEALAALEKMADPKLMEAVFASGKNGTPPLRMQAVRILAEKDPASGIELIRHALTGGTLLEKQNAYNVLGSIKSPEADAILLESMQKLKGGQIAGEVQLEVIEAAGKRPNDSLKSLLAEFESARAEGTVPARFQEVLVGGVAENGKKIFFDKTEVSCQRCHKIKTKGGEVGPELTKIASQKPREYMLESLVDPNKEIAQGFDTVVVLTSEGEMVSGVLKAEDDKELKLMNAEGKMLTVLKEDIEERRKGKSAMPEDLLKHLSKRELRDLIEFLANQKQ